MEERILLLEGEPSELAISAARHSHAHCGNSLLLRIFEKICHHRREEIRSHCPLARREGLNFAECGRSRNIWDYHRTGRLFLRCFVRAIEQWPDPQPQFFPREEY